MPAQGKLSGKVAVITGASTGIGVETARLFSAEGATVFITGRRRRELEAAAVAISGAVHAVCGDVSRLPDLDRLVESVRQKTGKLDIIFANAGLARLVPVGEVTEKQFDELFDVNVKGLFFTVQKLLPLMNDGGSIILNASVAASKGSHNFSVYSATKAAVRSFASCWTMDLKERGIRVNAISPGPIDTPIVETMGLTAEQREQFPSRMAGKVPMGRMGRASEVAQAALFLASDAASYITGIDLPVDGGLAQA